MPDMTVCKYSRALARILIGVTSLLVLSACGTVTSEQSLRDHQTIGNRADQANRQLRESVAPPPIVILEDTPHFAKKSIALNRGHLLPANIGLVSLHLPGKHNLRTVAAHIERLTQIPIVLAPDALIPIHEFGASNLQAKSSKGSSAAANSGQAMSEPNAQITKSAAQLVEQSGGTRQWEPPQIDQDLIDLNHRGTLATLLDHVAAQTQLQWQYESGHIRFYRMVTRVISVNALSSSVSQTGSINLPAGMGNMSMSSSSEINFWAGIEKSTRDMVSSSGKLTFDSTLGIITVTDILSNIKAIERFIDGINKELGRQVSLTVEVLQVSLNAENQAGIDWNYVASSAKLGQFSLTAAPLVTSSSSGVSLIKTSPSGTGNSFFIKALERFGRVSTSYSSVINTMNRQPVPLGSVSTQSYLKQVAPSQTTNAAGVATYGAPALTPGEITTGFTISLLPVVLNSNRVMMQCALSISSLKELTTFSSGTGLAQQSIQQPNVASFATQQRMTVNSGETIVLSGFDSESTESRESDVVRKTLPGTRTHVRNKNTLVVLITPRVLDL